MPRETQYFMFVYCRPSFLRPFHALTCIKISFQLFLMLKSYLTFRCRIYARTATPRNFLSCRRMPIQASMTAIGSLRTDMWHNPAICQLQISMPRALYSTQPNPRLHGTVFRGRRIPPCQVIHVTRSLWHMASLPGQCTISIPMFTIALQSRQEQTFACLYNARASTLCNRVTIARQSLSALGS